MFKIISSGNVWLSLLKLFKSLMEHFILKMFSICTDLKLYARFFMQFGSDLTLCICSVTNSKTILLSFELQYFYFRLWKWTETKATPSFTEFQSDPCMLRVTQNPSAAASSSELSSNHIFERLRRNKPSEIQKHSPVFKHKDEVPTS